VDIEIYCLDKCYEQLKQELYKLCREYIVQKGAMLQKAIAEIQEAMNNESKSSAGDKYETAREMLEQDIDVHIVQLNELNKQKEILDKINPNIRSTSVVHGSLVKTNNTHYYIAISAGAFKLNGATCYAISSVSPIGAKLMGQKPGNRIVFNGKEIVIEEIA
jgi:transcription elongation GreA/GreB family factor